MLQLLLFLIFSISVLIKCRANQLNGFYMMATLAFSELMLKTALTPITLGVY